MPASLKSLSLYKWFPVATDRWDNAAVSCRDFWCNCCFSFVKSVGGVWILGCNLKLASYETSITIRLWIAGPVSDTNSIQQARDAWGVGCFAHGGCSQRFVCQTGVVNDFKRGVASSSSIPLRKSFFADGDGGTLLMERRTEELRDNPPRTGTGIDGPKSKAFSCRRMCSRLRLWFGESSSVSVSQYVVTRPLPCKCVDRTELVASTQGHAWARRCTQTHVGKERRHTRAHTKAQSGIRGYTQPYRKRRGTHTRSHTLAQTGTSTRTRTSRFHAHAYNHGQNVGIPPPPPPESMLECQVEGALG